MYRSVEALWAPGLAAWSVKKVSKSPKDPQKSQKVVNISVWGLFEIFWGFRGSGVWRLLYVGFNYFTSKVGFESCDLIRW